MRRIFTSLGVLPDDHQKFKRIAFKREMKLYDLFHEVVEREMKDEVV